MSAAPVVYGGPLGFAAPPEIAIECDAFSGSLATLVKCVANQKLDLCEVPLWPICEAFLDYLRESNLDDVEGASTALVAMAYLVERKAYRLLPIPPKADEEELGPDFSGPSILEYHDVLEELDAYVGHREDLFFRSTGSEEYELPVELGKVSVDDLSRALESLLKRAVQKEDVIVGRPRRSLADQMNVVQQCLPFDPAPLEDIVQGEFTRTEAVWWFLALLELIRTGCASVDLSESGQVVFWKVGK